jgi:hypothetical protein
MHNSFLIVILLVCFISEVSSDSSQFPLTQESPPHPSETVRSPVRSPAKQQPSLKPGKSKAASTTTKLSLKHNRKRKPAPQSSEPEDDVTLRPAHHRKRKAPPLPATDSESDEVEDVTPPPPPPPSRARPVPERDGAQGTVEVRPGKHRSRTQQLASLEGMDVGVSPIPGPSTAAIPPPDADSDYTDIDDEEVPALRQPSGRL